MRSAIAVALCAVGLSAAAFAEPVTYLDWDDANKKMTNAICTAFELVTADTATFEAGKTYVVQGTVEQSVHGITVEGTSSNPTRLILCDGAKLTVTGQSAAETAGLNVSNGTAIVICGQNGGTGVLEATGGAGAAGIGGNAGQAAGTVTIYGGSVTALGKNGAAGIGGGMNNTDTGTVTFGAKFIIKAGADAASAQPIAQGDYVNDHSAIYAHIEPLQGCEDNPWKVGGTDGTDSVVAWTNGTDKLVIEGAGSVTNLADAVKDGITEITIKVGVTGAADGVFAGFNDVALTLPDNWQGGLPDEDGNWYGATGVEMTGDYPLSVKDVTFRQRYPWNGLVDVGFTLTGPNDETNVVITVCTNGTKIADFTAAVTIPADGVLATNLVWDAMTAGLAANFKSDDVTVEVAIAGGDVDPTAPVQLWADGPYFATCNVGANAPQESGYYFWWGDTVGYTNSGSAWLSVVDGTSIQFNGNDPTATNTYKKTNAELKSLGYIDDESNPVLNATHDAAKVKLGDLWRMMTKVELDALTNTAYCTSAWTDNWNNTGVKGYIVTGNTSGYTDKSIFLPAAGYGINSKINNAGMYGCYWSSTPDSVNSNNASCLAFSKSAKNDGFRAGSLQRYYGYIVRAVRDTPPEDTPAPVAPVISAKSAAGALDLTVGVDRVAKDTETIAVDPAWGNASEAQVQIDGEASARMYSSASNDTWDTTALTPGRYTLALLAGDVNESAAFWKLGAGWVVFDGSNVTADVTFEAGKTYLFFGTNTVAGGVTLKVADGAKFFYGEGVPSGFLGEEPAELSKRYETKTVGDLYQIVEKIKGCEDNPWDVGEGVAAYTNGNELVIGGAGTVGALSGVDGLKDLLAGLTAINVTSNGVTGAEAQAFADVGTDGGSVSLSLPDGWQGELPDEDGNWYGATGVTLTAYPLAVRNIQTATHWPWDGKIDITCDLTGKGEVNLSVALTTNGVAVCEATTLDGETAIDLGKGLATNGVRLVWSAQRDIADANFNAANAVIEVTAATKGVAADPAVGGVQLWEGGPIWAGCNVGATTPEDYGNLYLFSTDKAKDAAESLGAGWRLPTKDEFDNLLANCDSQWDTTKKGWMFTGKDTYASKSVFFRAAGRDYGNDGRKNANYEGNYWSSTEGDPNSAWILYFSYYVSNPKINVRSNEIPDNAFSVCAVRDAPSPASEISSASDAFRFDLREAVALAEGETTVAGVTWSATLWGELDEEFVTAIGWTNLTTGATGVFSNLAGVVGEAAEDADLPQKDGEYVLTHSTGDLTSFATFTVSGYPLGSEGNPWEIGANAAADVIAFTNGSGTVFFKPARGTASVAALQSVTNALSGYVPGPGELKVVSADGTVTNDVVMLLGSDGVPYDTLADVLAADPMPTTVRLFEEKGASVEFNAMGGVHTNGLEVLTNFFASAYTLPEDPVRTNYTFLGWYDGWTNGAAVVSNGWDLLRYEPHTLYAKWWTKETSDEGEGESVIGSDAVPGAETATITGAVASVGTDFVIPDRVSNGADGAAVVEIGQEAFCRANCATTICSVTTPVHLKKIGVRAFYQQQSLSKLVITPPRKYDNPTLPENLQICQSAFAGTAIVDVEIPDANVAIDPYAFQNCKTVKTITFLGDGANVTVHPTAFKLAGRANGPGGLKIYASQTFLVNHPTLVDDVTKGNPSITVYMRPDEGKPISLAFTGSPEILDGGKVRLTLKAGTTAKWASPDISDLKVYGAVTVDGDYDLLPHESEELTPNGEVKVVVTPGTRSFFRATVQE